MANCPVDHKGKFEDDAPNSNLIRRSDLVLKGVDESPEVALGSDAVNSFRGEIGTKFWKLIQLPSDFLAKVPEALQGFYNPVISAKNDLIHKRLPSMVKRWRSIRDEHKIDPKDYPRLIDHVFGLRGDSKGGYTQTLEGADPKLDAAARVLRRRVFAAAFKDVTGIDERVASKLRELGIEPKGKDFELVVQLLRGDTPRSAKPAHLDTALWVLEEQKKTGKNLVNLDPSYDVTGRHIDGYFTMIPIDNELAHLEHEVQSNQAMLDGGMLTPEKHQEYSQILAQKKARLERVKQELEDRLNRDFPKMESLPRRHFSQYFNELKKKGKDALTSPEGNPLGAEFDFIKDIDTVVERYLGNAYQKRFFDYTLHKAREILPQIKDPDVRAYITTWTNAIRGIRGFLEDRFIVDAVNSLKRFFGRQQSFTEDDLRKVVSEIMKFQALSKLFISPRFAIVNATQPFMTVYPIFGGKIFGRAFARAAAPLFEALASGEVTPYRLFNSIYSSKTWLRARAAGAIKGDGYLIEAEGAKVRGFQQIISAIPTLTEDFNRVLAYEAGVDWLKTHGSPNPFLKTYFVPEGKSITSPASLHAHGRAAVHATQFMFGTEGRPLGLIGGSARRLGGQFKTFSVAYGTLVKDALKHGRRTGDWGPYARMLGTLWFFGGIPATAAAASFGTSSTMYEETRNWLIRNAGIVIPRSAGITSVLDRVGLGGMSPIDVTSSIEPFNVPKRPSDVLPFLLGPTFGGVFKIYQKGKEEGMEGATEAAAGAISPLLAGALRSGRMYAEGGLRTRGGELEMRQTTPQLIAQTFGLQKPASATKGELLRDIEEAYVGGQTGLARQLERDARTQNNLIIGDREKSALKGRVTTRRKKSFLHEIGR